MASEAWPVAWQGSFVVLDGYAGSCFILDSSPSGNMVEMSEARDAHTEEKQNTPPPRRPPRRQTRWWALWASGTVVVLAVIVLLVVKLDFLEVLNWEDLSRARKELVALLIGLAVAITTLIILLAIGGASLGWTGFGEKKLWDWLELLSTLAIPVVLAAAGFWFTTQQDSRQQHIEDQRARQAQKLENQRAEAERELAQERAQDETLQAYLDQMSHLLLEKDLRDSEQGSVVRTLARARTFAVMPRLDAQRNRTVALFLGESKLTKTEGTTVGLLKAASLNHVDLAGVVLARADLSEADLSNADLSGAYLADAKLRTTFLSDADLSGAILYDAEMYSAQLGGANLADAYLSGAELRNAYLSGAILSDANLSDTDLSGANLRNADLSGANLRNADLSGAYLHNADLSGAKLKNADLSGATLSSIDLSHVEINEAKSLEGAFMPNNQQYEDWCQDRGNCKVNGENQ